MYIMFDYLAFYVINVSTIPVFFYVSDPSFRSTCSQCVLCL